VKTRIIEAPPVGATVQSNKSADELGGWPLSWWTQATTDLLRTWGQFSQFGLQPAGGQRSTTATEPATEVPVTFPELDPPTSGDRLFHATIARFTAGVSPASLGLAYADWALHLAASPGKWQLKFVGLGRTLNLRDIKCPVYLLAGASDDVTTPEQVLDAAKYLGTPKAHIVKKTVPGGHIGMFMGARNLKEHWPPTARWIATQ
jgi:pimeloyl-ACP methyl ester carboxylesterase